MDGFEKCDFPQKPPLVKGSVKVWKIEGGMWGLSCIEATSIQGVPAVGGVGTVAGQRDSLSKDFYRAK